MRIDLMDPTKGLALRMMEDQARRAREYRLREHEEQIAIFRAAERERAEAERKARAARRIAEAEAAARRRAEAERRARAARRIAEAEAAARRRAEAVALVAAAAKRVPASSPARRVPATDADFKRWASQGEVNRARLAGRVERRAFDQHGRLYGEAD